MKYLQQPLSTASDVLRYLLRHCLSLVTARNSVGVTLNDNLTGSSTVELAYARRLPAAAGGSFIAACWSAAGFELCRSQGGAAAVPVIGDGAEYPLLHPLLLRRQPGAHEDDH